MRGKPAWSRRHLLLPAAARPAARLPPAGAVALPPRPPAVLSMAPPLPCLLRLHPSGQHPAFLAIAALHPSCSSFTSAPLRWHLQITAAS